MLKSIYATNRICFNQLKNVNRHMARSFSSVRNMHLPLHCAATRRSTMAAQGIGLRGGVRQATFSQVPHLTVYRGYASQSPAGDSGGSNQNDHASKSEHTDVNAGASDAGNHQSIDVPAAEWLDSPYDKVLDGAEAAAGNVAPTANEVFVNDGVLTQAQMFLGESLLSLKHLLGLPWIPTIFAVTIILRLCVAPLMIRAALGAENAQQYQAPMKELQLRLKAENDPVKQAELALEMRELQGKMGMGRMFMTALAQAPIFIAMFGALQYLARYTTELQSAGILWVTNLAVSDPTWAVQGTLAVTFVMSMVMSSWSQPKNLDQHPLLMPSIYLFFGIMMAILTRNFCAAVHLYWIFSNFYTMLWALCLTNNLFRSLIGLKPLRGSTQAQPKVIVDADVASRAKFRQKKK